jgi:uncharacterized membrane protein YgdD (TMEM256/DUF423 family)
MRILGMIGSIGLFLGVALGAFGAHALREHLSDRMLSVYETGVRYQIYHSLAILLAALFVERIPLFYTAGMFYAAGIVLFSFSLYLLAVTNTGWLGAITPLGGVCFLIGHAWMFYAFL